MNIITVMVNPAIDLHLSAESFKIGRDNRATITSRELGGKGINLSRALNSYGVESLLAYMVGRENEDEYRLEAKRHGIQEMSYTIDGFVRENMNIHTPESDTVIATESSPIATSDFLLFSSEILKKVDTDTVLCFVGSIPRGTDTDVILSFLRKAKLKGARLVIDTKSLTREEIISLKPYLIKPNEEEVCQLLGTETFVIERELPCLLGFVESGVENVIVTRGSEGGVFISSLGVFIGKVPKIDVISTVGAGDSTVAGFLAGIKSGFEPSDAFRLSLAFGCAACLSEGSMPPDPCQINRLKELIEIKGI